MWQVAISSLSMISDDFDLSLRPHKLSYVYCARAVVIGQFSEFVVCNEPRY